jgi:hypothetical protein
VVVFVGWVVGGKVVVFVGVELAGLVVVVIVGEPLVHPVITIANAVTTNNGSNSHLCLVNTNILSSFD